MIAAACIAILVLAMFVWQDGVNRCNDGVRYTSCAPQPTPFHRRFCYWPPMALQIATWLSFAFIATSLGTWWRSVLFITLPGVWFCATRPLTVDGPSMALAWAAALLRPTHPWIAIALAFLSGIIHERGPVFAMLYAGDPAMLFGLAGATLFWRHPAPRDTDAFVGLPTLKATVYAHKGMQDWLDWKAWLYPTRAIIPLAASAHIPIGAWAALVVASASRIIATDNARLVMWGVPPILMAIHDAPPHWLIALHAFTFIRVA